MEDSYPTMKRGIHLAHLNVQSARNKLDILKYHIKHLNFDLTALTETWFTKDMPDQLVNINGYDTLRLDRSWPSPGSNNIKKGGGIAVFVKSELSYSSEELKSHNMSDETMEVIWVTISKLNMKKS